jgi:hypothetical protein
LGRATWETKVQDSNAASQADLTRAVKASLRHSLVHAERFEEPYRHYIASRVFPPEVAQVLRRLPFAAADVGGVSGKRELHNDTRHYFDAASCARLGHCAAVADAFQSREVAMAVEEATGADLAGTYVRLEYAQDVDGFWLEPHTDLGVKRFTMLIYLTGSAAQADLGTDVYADHDTWAKRTAFADNSALMFVPAHNTWHGLERRSIAGVRTSVIMNYVTDAWRERGQLAYPETPVLA